MNDLQPAQTSPPERSPFHAGEQAVQTRLGVRDEIEPWARKVVRPTLPEPHRQFYAALPFLVAAARDDQGRPWATILADEPGFAHSPDPGHLEVRARPVAGDALAIALREGDDLGLLGIELHTRRRNRLNGRVTAPDSEGFTLSVDQAYGNCPQYIRARDWKRAPEAVADPVRRTFTRLTPAATHWIERADTFFIASGHRGPGEDPAFGMDASHRGGEPGFVCVQDERSIIFPDYAGNNHFNTLGNLIADPRAGLLFVDFEQGHMLQLTGRAFVDWEPTRLARFPGARRLVRFELDEGVELTGALRVRWDTDGGTVRELRVVDKVQESDDVTSFYFEPRDGSPFATFSPGQHLPIELDIPGHAAPVVRTYSLSSAPDDPRYRITVKRERQGMVSRYLHDNVEVGHILSARAPGGDFMLDASSPRPLVLVGAGVGLTPLVSMLRSLALKGDPRPVWFVHGVRDGRHHPLKAEVQGVAAEVTNARVHFAYSGPGPGDIPARDFDSRGRIDVPLLEGLVPGLGADFYLCGPTAFMASLLDGLEQRGVPTHRIHAESFGPSVTRPDVRA